MQCYFFLILAKDIALPLIRAALNGTIHLPDQVHSHSSLPAFVTMVNRVVLILRPGCTVNLCAALG